MPVLFGTLMTAAVIVAPVAEIVTLDAIPSVSTAHPQKSDDTGGDEDDEPHCTNLVCVDVVAADTLTFSAPSTSVEPTSSALISADEPPAPSPAPVLSTDAPAPEPAVASPATTELAAAEPTAAEPAAVEPTAAEPAAAEPAAAEPAAAEPVVEQTVASAEPLLDASASSEAAVAGSAPAPTLSTQTNAHGLDPAYSEETPLPVSGKVMYYAPGVMDRVINYRTREDSIDACAECVGHVALLRVGDINRKVWIQLEDGTFEGPFLVVDVAHPGDIDTLLARDWVVDVDWETAQRWSMKGPIAGTVLDAPPTN